jgi:hypothetical protein
VVLGILVVPQRPRNCERVGDGDSAVWALLIADRYLCIVAVLFIGKNDETCVRFVSKFGLKLVLRLRPADDCDIC